MEHNTDRLGFALIAIAVISIFLFFVNSIYQPSTANMFKGFRDWMQQGNGNSNSKFTTHWAYAWSADGKTRFTTVKPTDEIPPFVGKYSDSNASQSSDYNDYVWASNGDIDAAVPITHTAYSWSANGKDRFSVIKPNYNLLRGTRTANSVVGTNSPNQAVTIYYYDKPGLMADQGLKVGDQVTYSFDWSVTNPTKGNFYLQLSNTPWTSICPTITISPSNGSGHVTSTVTITDDMIKGNVNGINRRADYLPTNSTLTISNMKMETGAIATAWMPSQSEATSSDGPKYIGTYTDINKKQSQDPASYTWKAAS